MPSLKPLRSVAHNLAHHFASTLNYWDDDYAINHLARAAQTAEAHTVVIDVLGQSIQPISIQVGVVAEFVPYLKRSLGELLQKEGVESVVLVEAKLKYVFAANKLSLTRGGMPIYDCICSLETIDGRCFEAHLTERNN
jgi:hypothetical protein